MLAVTDIRISEKCRTTLLTRGFSIISLPPFSTFDPRVASHPDMLILPLGDRMFVHKKYYTEAKETIDRIINATSLSLTLTDDAVGAEYPCDVSLNLAILGNHVIGRRTNMAKAVQLYAEEHGISIFNTNQGYAKCSTVTLGDKAVITADPAMEKTCRALSINVLRISEGHVALDGFDHGFIGGASGVCNHTVFFCGDILTHPDGKNILSFCSAHGFDVISLSDEGLYDVGSLFFF